MTPLHVALHTRLWSHALTSAMETHVSIAPVPTRADVAREVRCCLVKRAPKSLGWWLVGSNRWTPWVSVHLDRSQPPWPRQSIEQTCSVGAGKARFVQRRHRTGPMMLALRFVRGPIGKSSVQVLWKLLESAGRAAEWPRKFEGITRGCLTMRTVE